MEIPSVPSDTIYKFSTVLGVVLIIFSLHNWYHRLNSVYTKIETENKKNILLRIEQAYLKSDIIELKNELDTFAMRKTIKQSKMYQNNKSNIYMPKRLKLEDSLVLFKYQLKEKYSKDSILNIRMDLLNYKIRTLEENRWNLLIEKNISGYESFNNIFRQIFLILTIILGFFMTIWGFKTWHKKEFKRKKKK